MEDAHACFQAHQRLFKKPNFGLRYPETSALCSFLFCTSHECSACHACLVQVGVVSTGKGFGREHAVNGQTNAHAGPFAARAHE